MTGSLTVRPRARSFCQLHRRPGMAAYWVVCFSSLLAAAFDLGGIGWGTSVVVTFPLGLLVPLGLFILLGLPQPHVLAAVEAVVLFAAVPVGNHCMWRSLRMIEYRGFPRRL